MVLNTSLMVANRNGIKLLHNVFSMQISLKYESIKDADLDIYVSMKTISIYKVSNHGEHYIKVPVYKHWEHYIGSQICESLDHYIGSPEDKHW